MSIFSKLKKIVGTVSPLLGGALGGPLGGMVGKMVQKALGVDSDSAALTILESNPDSLLKLKQIEADLEVRMEELGITEEQIHADDRDSARALAKEKGITPQVIMSIVYTIGYFVVVFMFMANKIQVPPEHSVMFGGLLGVLSASQIQIMNFWFGSSAGSKRKTEVMAANGAKQ